MACSINFLNEDPNFTRFYLLAEIDGYVMSVEKHWYQALAKNVFLQALNTLYVRHKVGSPIHSTWEIQSLFSPTQYFLWEI